MKTQFNENRTRRTIPSNPKAQRSLRATYVSIFIFRSMTEWVHKPEFLYYRWNGWLLVWRPLPASTHQQTTKRRNKQPQSSSLSQERIERLSTGWHWLPLDPVRIKHAKWDDTSWLHFRRHLDSSLLQWPSHLFIHENSRLVYHTIESKGNDNIPFLIQNTLELQ